MSQVLDMQAAVLVAGQVVNLSDPILNGDPLFGVTGDSSTDFLTSAYRHCAAFTQP